MRSDGHRYGEWRLPPTLDRELDTFALTFYLHVCYLYNTSLAAQVTATFSKDGIILCNPVTHIVLIVGRGGSRRGSLGGGGTHTGRGWGHSDVGSISIIC